MKKFRKTTVDLLLRYLSNNPMEKLPAIFTVAEQLDRDQIHAGQIKELRALLSDRQGMWYRFTENLFKEVNLHSLQKFVECFLLNASLDGAAIAREAEENTTVTYHGQF